MSVTSTSSLQIPRDVRRSLERAAAAVGQTVDAFALSSLRSASRRALDRERETVLSERDAKRFLALLDDDAKPNAALKAAALRFRKRVHGS